MLIETKTYIDGTKATGAAPMPDLSPRQQEFVGMLDDVLESLRRGRVALEWSNQLDQVANVVRSMDQVREAIARIKCTPEQPAAAAVSDAEIDRICYLATEIRFAKTDDAAQAVIDKIRAILALRPQAVPMTGAARDVLAERHRQISAEGWTPEHDDEHDKGEIAVAAAIYALRNRGADPALWVTSGDRPNHASRFLDDVRHWVKGGSTRRNLIKAGALILAEIERLDRASGITAQAKEGGA